VRYRRNAGSVTNLNYHLVFCPKYRRPVLVGAVAERLTALLLERAADLAIEVVSLEVMPDHVHFFLSAPPTEAVQHFVNQFKGYTSRVLRQEFPDLRTRLPSLWSRSYYAGSAGHVSSETIARYIANQKRS
jgi:putative transposase